MLNADRSRNLSVANSSTGSTGIIGSTVDNNYPRTSSGSRITDRTKLPWFISLLIAIKIASSLATFMLADFLTAATLNHSPLSTNEHYPPTGAFGRWSPALQTIAVIQLCSGIVFVAVQKPFTSWGKPGLTCWEMVRVFRHAIISIVYLLIWSSGLQLCGPFRTAFIACHYDFTLAAILAAFFVVKSGSRLRGAVLFSTGILVLLLFDDITTGSVHHRTKRNTEMEEHTFISKNSIGILTLVLSLFYKLGFNAFAKNLAVDLGGSKRLHALSTFISGVFLMFLFLNDLMAGADMIPVWENFFTLTFIIIFGFVLDYYVDSICTKRMETSQVSRIGTTAIQFSALLFSLVWISSNEVPSVATLIAFALVYVGVLSLTSSEKASGGGSFVGYSSDGLPLFSFSNHFSGDYYIPLWKDVILWITSLLRQIQDDATSRKIFYFFILNFTFTCVEFLYGSWTNSLGLISDGFHMLFDSMALVIGLCASIVCRWKPSKTFPFGYGRVEVLSGFLNTLFLLVVAGVIFIEAIERLRDPPSVDANRLLPISVFGLFVNLIGIYAFKNSGVDHHLHSHNTNIRGVFLHVLADTMGSIGVIISTILIQRYDLLIADPLCSLVIAALIVVSVLPLMKDTARILMLTAPEGLERNVQQAVLQILTMEGVKGYRTPRFWTHAPQVFTGSMHIHVTQDANEQQVIRQVNNLFSSIGFNHFTTQVEKDEFISRKNFNIDVDDQEEEGDDYLQDKIARKIANNFNGTNTTENNKDSNSNSQHESSFEITLA